MNYTKLRSRMGEPLLPSMAQYGGKAHGSRNRSMLQDAKRLLLFVPTVFSLSDR